jgi:drug/metabolite transporter (DMT)-like permease
MWCFPFLAGATTTVTNMAIIYTSSPIFIIIISAIFFQEKINFLKIIGLISCLIGVFAIIIKGDLNLLINLKFTIGDLMDVGCCYWLGTLFNLSILLEI